MKRKERERIIEKLKKDSEEKQEKIKAIEKVVKRKGYGKEVYENKALLFFISWIGRRIRVKRSSSTFKNLAGTVVWETKNTFKIITLDKDKKLRIKSIPKKGNAFQLFLKGKSITIEGDKISFSPIERAKRGKRMRKWEM